MCCLVVRRLDQNSSFNFQMDKYSDRLEEANKSNKSSKTIILNENRSSDEDKLSLQSLVCRICFEDCKEEPIITPCHCKGTVAYVHKTCLEKWLSESNTTACELCHHVYETERIPKYTAKQSVWHWLWYQPQNVGFQVRRVRGDLLACAILTPLAILVTYVCLFSADYYNQQNYSNIPVAKWTSLSLLIMISLLLFGYYLWVYVVIGYHGRTWYYWWQRECTVRYIPPVSNSCCEISSPITNQTEINMQPEIDNTRNADAVVIYVNASASITENPDPNVQSCSDNCESNVENVAVEINKSTDEADTNNVQIASTTLKINLNHGSIESIDSIGTCSDNSIGKQ